MGEVFFNGEVNSDEGEFYLKKHAPTREKWTIIPRTTGICTHKYLMSIREK